MIYKLILFCICINIFVTVESARILGVFPVPSPSHHIVFSSLTRELANRGHELVIITPIPTLPKERPPDNITEIDVGLPPEAGIKMFQENIHLMKRGMVIDVETSTSLDPNGGLYYIVSEVLKNPKVKQLIEDKKQKFDLIIVESMMNMQLVFTEIFKAPAISFTSFIGLPEMFDAVGAVAWHPILYPNALRNKFKDLSFWEKLQEICYEWKLTSLSMKGEELENKFIKTILGPKGPTVAELKNNIAMFFVNGHPLFGNNRPVPPSVIYLGAVHLQPVKELPQDLKSYLDNSKKGVIYVSLGTNVHVSLMEESLLDAFLNAFAELPYDILWKFDGESNGKIPKNVKIQKWFPQRDLLTHPNIKLFITQGGLQSTDEAIDAGVPLVGIPTMGDQWYNVDKCVELGIAVQLNALTMTSDDIVQAAKTVIGNDSYRRNVAKLRALMLDQPQRPLERAVWWTEHVLRHGGARHLRAPAANMTWSEYFMADVLLTLTIAFISIIFVAFTLALYLIRIFFVKGKNKVKQN